jgi:hypothetical protein
MRWRWIAYHLVQAGRKDELRHLLLDFNYLSIYLEAKLAATDTKALIADFDYLAVDEELRLIQSAIRLSAHVLVRNARQLAGQLMNFSSSRSRSSPVRRILRSESNDFRGLQAFPTSLTSEKTRLRLDKFNHLSHAFIAQLEQFDPECCLCSNIKCVVQRR